MAAAAQTRGYEYIAITDYSKGLKITGDIDEAVLSRQGEEIAEVNQSILAAAGQLHVLRSIEMGENFVAGSWQGIDKLTALMLAGEKPIAFADPGEKLQSTKSRPAIE